MRVERRGEGGQRIGERPIEARHLGQRAPGRLVAAHALEDEVAAAHLSAPRFFRYHWRKVDGGDAGTSRCRPQALNGL